MLKYGALVSAICAGFAVQAEPSVNERTVAGPGAVQITAEIWVDNWFALYANGLPVIEDSVPLTTEKSFNAERVTFSADLPLTLGFEFHDFMQNETGLEYIGTDRQQMGDGGAIAQFRDATTGKMLAVTDANWRCTVVQAAPVSDDCAASDNPVIGQGACASKTTALAADWAQPGFDDRGWPAATEHSAWSVGPKGGYDQIDWDNQSALIWGPDLVHDNVVMCRLTISE